MPGVSFEGATCSGHGCYPPRPSTSGSSDVFVEGIAVLRAGDSYAPHTCGDSTHGGAMAEGSGTVTANGHAVVRIGDGVDCGSVCAECVDTVFAGD